MKTSFFILLIVLVLFAATASAQTTTVDYINQPYLQFGLGLGNYSGPEGSYRLAQFNIVQYSSYHLGFVVEPTIGLAGTYPHQVAGSPVYALFFGLQWTVWHRSAIVGGYAWVAKYDGIQLSDAINRRSHGPSIGVRYNCTDGLWVPHGNVSVEVRALFLNTEDRTTGWQPEYNKSFLVIVGYNFDLSSH